MRQFLLVQLIIATFIFAQTDGEVVKNVTAAQRTDGSKILDIYYDLEESELYATYDIYVQLEWPDDNQSFYLEQCSGDIWMDVFPGTGKHISCQLADNDEDPDNDDIFTQFLSGEFYINVQAISSAASEIPFNMIEFNASVDSEILNYDFELMDKEVTAIQFVEFLTQYLSSAENVINMDEDDWPNEEGGEIYKRLYQFGDNKPSVYIEQGVNESGLIQLMNENGNNQIFGTDLYPPIFSMLSESEYHMNAYIIHLATIDENDEIPVIQFSSTAAGADDFSFFISPGLGNYPITGVSYLGAKLFSDFYGLRLPYFKEYVFSMYDDLSMINDYFLYSDLDELLQDDFNNIAFELYLYHQIETFTPADQAYQFENGLFGMLDNASDMILYKYNNHEVYNYAQYAVASMVGYGNDFPELLYNDFSTFRCARTIHGSYTGSD